MLAYLSKNKDKVVTLLSGLIRIPTVNPPGENYEVMVSFIDKECKKLGLKTKKYLTPKALLDKFGLDQGSKRISLVADWSTGAKKTLHINSHYDVVPATDNWRTDPFKAVIKGNKIYGRGSEDMKGNIACVLFALQAMKAAGVEPKINIQLSFTPDEEIGGMTGLGYLVQKNFVKADYAMSEGYSGNYVSIGNKGVLWGEVTVKGKAHHASIPYKGVNAFDRMLVLAGEIKRLQARLSKRKTRYKMRDSISRRPTLVMGGNVTGGVKVNVVPGEATFSIDRRVIPEESILKATEEILEIVRRFNKKYKDSKAYVKFMAAGEPAISKKNKNFFETVSRAVGKVTGKSAKFCLLPGATDVRYFMWKGIPSLGYSARGGESWHSDNEFVYIDSLVDTAKVFMLVMSGLE